MGSMLDIKSRKWRVLTQAESDEIQSFLERGTVKYNLISLTPHPFPPKKGFRDVVIKISAVKEYQDSRKDKPTTNTLQWNSKPHWRTHSTTYSHSRQPQYNQHPPLPKSNSQFPKMVGRKHCTGHHKNNLKQKFINSCSDYRKESDNGVCPPLYTLLCGPPISPDFLLKFEFSTACLKCYYIRRK
jgi:hypothetical protein